MASPALAAFYRGREAPWASSSVHAPADLPRFVAALEVMLQEARAPPDARGMAERRATRPTLEAAVAGAERMAALAPASVTAPLKPRIAALRDGVAQCAAGPLPAPCHALDTDEYWDDYLYAGLAVPTSASVDDADADGANDAESAGGAGGAAHGLQDNDETPTSGDVATTATPGVTSGLRRRPGGAAPSAPAAAPVTEAGITSERSLQEALSSELLRMAAVLKKNSASFAESLERDRQLVEQTTGRLDQNLSLMTRTRGQLGMVSKTARSMGWFTLSSILGVVVCWMAMFVLIRLT